MHITESLLNESTDRRTRGGSFPSTLAILTVSLMLTIVSCGGTAPPPSGTPVANPGGPYLGNVNQALAFNGSASAAASGKSLVSFVWNFGDGGSAMGTTVSHTYTLAGNFTATLTVTDSAGMTGSSSVAVQIITAPVAKPGGPYSGKVGVAVSFNGSASTAPPGQSLGFTWNFGDGASATGATPTHTYGTVCTCTVTLTVTDDTAGVSTATTTATIAAGPEPGESSAAHSTFFAIGPAANASTQFSYVATSSGNGATSLSIETIDTSTGELRAADLTPRSLDGNFIPSGMITDPSRKFLYLYGGNSILTFSISPDTGALSPSGATATNGNTETRANQILVFTPDAKNAFFITQDASDGDTAAPGSVTRFSVDSNTGMLGAIETISTQISNPQAAAIDPAGKFLYISGVASDQLGDTSSTSRQIAIFMIAPDTGAITPTSGSPLVIRSRIFATSMTVDSTGRFLYAAGRDATANTAALSVLKIDASTGGLTQSSSPLLLGNAVLDATSIALSTSANFGYVLTISSRNDATVHQSVRSFHWDAKNGSPTIGDSSIENDVAANQFTLPVANLILFSASPVDGTNAATSAQAAFLFWANLPDKPVNEYSIDPNKGSFNWLAAPVNSAGH